MKGSLQVKLSTVGEGAVSVIAKGKRIKMKKILIWKKECG